jgi:hypothetical protein
VAVFAITITIRKAMMTAPKPSVLITKLLHE